MGNLTTVSMNHEHHRDLEAPGGLSVSDALWLEICPYDFHRRVVSGSGFSKVVSVSDDLCCRSFSL